MNNTIFIKWAKTRFEHEHAFSPDKDSMKKLLYLLQTLPEKILQISIDNQ